MCFAYKPLEPFRPSRTFQNPPKQQKDRNRCLKIFSATPYFIQWRHMIRNYMFLCESLGISVFVPNVGILDMSSWLYTQLFTRNPNLQSELTGSFTQRRKLRKANL